MQRAFGYELLACSNCGRKMQLLDDRVVVVRRRLRCRRALCGCERRDRKRARTCAEQTSRCIAPVTHGHDLDRDS
jgi:hypothetical protein